MIILVYRLPDDDSSSYKVEWHGRYEPFYVAARKDVRYDERFVQVIHYHFTMNRRTQNQFFVPTI